MSYNISSWTTKKLDELKIPLDAFYNLSSDLVKRGWRTRNPEITSIDNDHIFIKIDFMDASHIEGELLMDKKVAVNKIYFGGEGSGTLFFDILKPALEKSTGTLEAVLVWEGGDCISRLTVVNGVVTDKEIEL